MKMKFTILSISGIIGGFSICPFNSAQAIEPPADNTRPPAALLGDSSEIPKTEEAAPKANVAFLGLATVELPEMVADHLGIAPGSAVIIRTVCPDSPAAKAGLSVNDIIVDIDGSAVSNPEAVSSLMRDHKVGDRVALNLIHKGKPAKVEVTLAERPVDQVAGGEQMPLLEGLPKAHADRLRSLLERNLQAFGNGGGLDDALSDPQLQNNLRMMKEQMKEAFGENAGSLQQSQDGSIQFQQNSTVRMMDGDGSVELRSSDGKAEATVRDKNNEVAWSGSWNTDEEKAAAPEDIRKRIDRISSGSGNGTGFNFRFGKLRDKDADTIDN